MCTILKISRSSYYTWLNRKVILRKKCRVELKTEIKRVIELSKKRYGSPSLTVEMNCQAIKASIPLLVKLMLELGLRSIVKRKFRIITNSKHKFTIAKNHLNREFITDTPNQVWVSDITYLRSKEGWSYLTTVIDLYDRKVIG